MLFETQAKADNFIRFNAGEMADGSVDGQVPVRSYYCPSCGGWHVTHHSLTRRRQRFDDAHETAYQLQRFIDRLKNSYDNKDWRDWMPLMDEAYRQVEVLDRLPSYHNMLIEMKRQLRHYKSMIDASEKKEKKRCRQHLSQLVSLRKQLFDEIRTFMAGMDIVAARGSGKQLCELMDNPAYAFFEEHIKQDCESLASCFRDGSLYDTLVDMTCVAVHLKSRHAYMTADELRQNITWLDGQLDVLRAAGMHRFVIQPYTEAVARYMRVLQNRGSGTDGAVEKAAASLGRLYDMARRYLVDCIDALMAGNRKSAFISLNAADEHIRTLPISGEKVELMNLFTQVAMQGDLFRNCPVQSVTGCTAQV